MANIDLELQTVMLEGGYTPSILTDFLVNGLENLRKSNEIIIRKDLHPDPNIVQKNVFEAFATIHKTPQPKRPARAGQGDGQIKVARSETPPAAVSIALPASRQKPESEETGQSGRKRKLAVDLDVELENAAGDAEELADEFGARLHLDDESTAPSTKRRKMTGRKILLPNSGNCLARRPQEPKSLDKMLESEKWEEWAVQREPPRSQSHLSNLNHLARRAQERRCRKKFPDSERCEEEEPEIQRIPPSVTSHSLDLAGNGQAGGAASRLAAWKWGIDAGAGQL